jgi:endonuclease YncB( thermonuclease family)
MSIRSYAPALMALLLAIGAVVIGMPIGGAVAQPSDDDGIPSADEITHLIGSASNASSSSSSNNGDSSSSNGNDDGGDEADSSSSSSADNADSSSSSSADNATGGSSADDNADSSSSADNATGGSSADDNADSSSSADNATGGSSADDNEEGNIMINEIELNPQSNDVDMEWIELYNPSDSDVNIGDYRIRASKSTVIDLPSDAEIKAGETYVIELDRQLLSDIAEIVVLESGSGEVVDSTPSFVDRSDDSRTWQRMPDGNNEWQFASDTEEELNSQEATMDFPSIKRGGASGSEPECIGSAGCAEGMAIRIVDGDTLYVSVNDTVYKVNLALAKAPLRGEESFIESTVFTRSLCLGSRVLVDQDDEQLTSGGSIIATVYCSSDNLNHELLENGYATFESDQCSESEFAQQEWARKYGC